MRDAHAVLVLPPAAHGKVNSPHLRRWLARGQLAYRAPDREMLAYVAELLGGPVPGDGMGALRFWGQSGQRSGSWMAAADPVHLEMRMRDVRICHVAPGEYDKRDLDELVGTLQTELGGDGIFDFIRLGSHAYVRASEPFDLPRHSTAVIHGEVPDPHVPTGADAARFHRLLGETEMIVHEHDVNARRAAAGKPPINSFWYWGGGVAPEPVKLDLPPLFSADPLFDGYWASVGASVYAWHGDLAACIEASAGHFVAVLPDMSRAAAADVMEQVLLSVREFLRRGELHGATMLFRDGLRATIRRTDRLKFWRLAHTLLEEVDE